MSNKHYIPPETEASRFISKFNLREHPNSESMEQYLAMKYQCFYTAGQRDQAEETILTPDDYRAGGTI